MSVEIILGQIAESLRDLVRETRASDIYQSGSSWDPDDDLGKIADALDTTNEKLEAIDTHLVEIMGAIPELARLIAAGMPTLVEALRKD